MAPSTIIVPLYIYPEPGAWTPLHESIQQHEHIHFILVVNPFNGPGPDAVPDANYVKEIPTLTAYPNVDVVGYVHTTFGRRELTSVTHEIERYANWSKQTQYPGLGINGIFVDETPNQYDEHIERYLEAMSEFAKRCGGFGGNKLVIHNPGCAPAPAYMRLADITIVFEDTWQNFDIRLNGDVFNLQSLFDGHVPTGGNGGRERLALMIHSVPKDSSAEQAKALVRQAKSVADVMFITEQDVSYYASWSPQWVEWVRLIATTAV